MPKTIQEIQQENLDRQNKAIRDNIKVDATPQQMAENLSKGPYVIKSDSGKREMVNGTPALAAASVNNQRLVKDSSGNYVEYKPSVSLNTKTGDIDISAPKSFLQSDYYKKEVKPTLESYSQAYKLNPDYKMPVSSEKGAEEHDIKWYVDKLNKDLPNILKAEDLRASESKRHGTNLSFDNLRTMNTSAVTYRNLDGSEHKVSDNDRQAIPNIPEANFLKEALKSVGAYDENTSTGDYRHLMDEGWNREKQSDENIIALEDAVNAYFDKGDFSDADLFAQMYAFRNFMNQQAPVTGFWRGTQDVIDNIGLAVLSGETAVAVHAENVAEGLENFAGTVGTNLSNLLQGKELQDKPYTGELNFVRDYLQPEYDRVVETHKRRTQMLNPSSAAVFDITRGLSEFIFQMSIGNAVTKVVTETAAAGLAAKTGIDVSKTTAQIIADSKNAVDGVEKAAYSIYAGTSFIMDGLSTAEATTATVSALNNLSTITQAINNGTALTDYISLAAKGAKALVWAVDMTAQATVDLALGRPDVVRAILDGDNEQDKALLLQEIGANALFWGGARALGGIGKAVRQTNVGRAATVQASAFANRISTGVGKATDRLKTWIFGADWKENLIAKRDAAARLGKAKKAQKLTNKIKTLANRENIRGQQEVLAKMSIFDEGDDIMQNVEKMEKQILNIKKAQLIADDANLQRATGQMFATLTNSDFDPEFKGSFDAYMDQLKEVVNAENAAGFGADIAKKGALKETGEKGVRILDQRTINYFNAKIHLAYDREYGEAVVEELNQFVKTFEDAASPELIEATDALVDRYREVNYQLHRIGLDPDLGLNFYNSNDIAELNNTRGVNGDFMFGENGRLYGKTVRVSEYDDWEKTLSRGVAENRSTVYSHAMDTANGAGDFVDPTYVLCTEITDRSRIAVTQANANILSTLPGVNAEVTVGAGATEQARLYKVDGYEGAVKGQAKASVENVETSKLFDTAADKGYPKGSQFNEGFAMDDEFLDQIDDLLNGYTDQLLGTKGGRNLMSRLNAHPGDIADKEFQYMAMSSLAANSEDMLDDIEKKAKDYYVGMFSSKKGIKKKDVEQMASGLAAEVRDAFSMRIEGRAADLAAELIENGSVIVDTNRLYTNVANAMLDIEGAKAAKDVVKIYDVQGRETYVKMDPLLADMFNNRPIPTDMSNFQKINNLWNRTFRLGTTGANLKSFMAQNVKDFGNAWVAGGADATIKEVTRNLTSEFGEEIVSQVQQFEPRAYSALSKRSAETGESLAELAVQRELSIGKAVSPSATETEAFNFMSENRAARFGSAGYYERSGYQRFNDNLSRVMEKLERPNAAREAYLRNLSYANGFSQAIEAGNTIKDARFSARFLMNNATTNFGREMYHLNNLRNSVPYLGAAINGTKSFWRLWSLDPIGMTGRILGGIAVPIVYLTGQSLSTEENRRIWKNIPEYQKDGNMVFISNGQIISIPIPEEMGGFINPIRQFVEHLHGVDPASFQELMLNDIIGLQPFNLDGFVMLDRNRLLADPTIWDRIGAGVSKFSAQIMPPAVKSAVIYVTGKDPYTGKAIPSSRVYIDENGEEQTMDYTAGSFAKMLGDLFGDAVSAPMAQTLLNNIIGNAGTDVLNGLWGDGQKLFSGDFEGLLTKPELAQNLAEQVAAPFTIDKYSLANSQWTQAVNQLYDKKMSMLNSDGYQAAVKGMKNATTEAEYERFKKAKQNYTDEYYAAVKDTVDRINSQYPQAFDSSKFAAVISLMNLDTTTYNQMTGNYGENEYNDYLHDQLKTSGKNAAISTMAELGFKSSYASSIFGYYGTEKGTGKAVIYYNDPISILNMKQAEQGADNIHFAAIKKIVDKNELFDEKKAVDEQVNSIYNKTKLSDSDYDKIDALYVEFNANVMKKVAPYIERMTPEAAINNEKVLDYLENLIELPGEYKKDRYGKYVTNKKLGNGSAKDAYIRSYIKNIFNVNDTGYEGGKNYSGRKSLGGK